MVDALPIFYYPTTVVILDDDLTLLTALKLVVDDIFNALCFQSSQDFCSYFNNYTSPLSNKNFLQSDFQGEFFGSLDRAAINFNLDCINTIIDQAEKYKEVSICILDNSLPDMDGFTAASEVKDKDIFKIMLTGTASGDEAIAGLNNKTINFFMRKGESELFSNLEEKLRELSMEFFIKKTSSLISVLEAEGKSPITDPVYARFFLDLCAEKNIEEFYLIDKSGSYLCIDKDKKSWFVILHTEATLAAWYETYSEDGLSEDLLSRIKTKELIPFFGVGCEAEQVDIALWHEHLYAANILQGRDDKYYYAIIEST